MRGGSLVRPIDHVRVLLSTAMAAGVVVVAAVQPASARQLEGVAPSEPPAFSKVFDPDTIGIGTTTTLTFTIDNSASASPVEVLAFTDGLPAGVVIASPAVAVNGCAGTLTAPDGGGTITLTGGEVGAGTSCTISVNVRGDSAASPHTNTTGDLTSDAGNSGTAEDELTVTGSLPGFTKVFSPTSVDFGDRSTLTFTIDNSLGDEVQSVLFDDPLPSGMFVAGPPNASTTCSGPLGTTLTADPGATSISLDAIGFLPGFPTLEAGGTCTVVVDVVGGAVGELGNTSGDLLVEVGGTSVGMASAVLDVSGVDDVLTIGKSFTTDPAPPGGKTSLQFTITNRSRDDDATDIAFTDDLDATLSGLEALEATGNTCGGMAASTFPTGFFEYEGGFLLPERSCTITLDVTVPAGAADGAYPNSTSTVTGDVGGVPVVGNTGNDLLFVVSFPVLTKEFTSDPVAAGGEATVTFTITNPSSSSTMSGISFEDLFDEILPTSTSGPPADGFCGVGSTASFTPLNPSGFPTNATFTVDDARLEKAGDPGDSCMFSITLDVDPAATSGIYPNTTSEIPGVLDDASGAPTVVGPPATDDLVVVGAPRLTKEFTSDPTAPGDMVTLEFTLENLDDTNQADDIGFVDDLGATLAGLTLLSELDNTCGGSVSGFTTDELTYSGGTLPASSSCSIVVTLTVPAGAGGTFTNTTSEVSATVAGLTALSSPAVDQLVVSGLLLDKEFLDDPAIPGDTVTLQFTLDNIGTVDASSISFVDDLDDALPGLAAVAPLPDTSSCGGGSSLSGTSVLIFSGGEVDAGASCSFDVTVLVPAGADDGNYINATSAVSSSLGSGPPAVDELTVDSVLLAMSKDFTDDPVFPDDQVTLQFDLENLSATETVEEIAFSDDLDAAVGGLEVTDALFNDCGGMAVSPFPTGLFVYEGGELPPGETCTITLDVHVPPAPLPGSVFTNSTSEVTGTVGGLDVFGDPASDDLIVDTVLFDKSFDGPTTAPGTAVLTFTIVNLDGVNGLTGLAFSDDLDDALAGLEAVAPFPTDPCGTGSALAGTSFLTMTDGAVAAGGDCTFDVTVSVPAAASSGEYLNVTSELFASGVPVADPAVDLLKIVPPPTFTKVFAPDTIIATTTSTLTFTIDNSTSTLAASALDFTDNLPAGVVVAALPAATTDCNGGDLTATAGSGTISYSGGSVDAGATCTVDVDVTSDTAGEYVNTTGDLTSSSGNSGAATDTLTVELNNALTSLTGRRFADTRSPGGQTFDGLFEADGALAAGSTYEVGIAGRGDVPGDAVGAIMNVTAVGPSAPPGFFTVFPCGAAPTASALNYVPLFDVANEVFAKLSPSGSVCVFTFSETDLLIDVVGYVGEHDGITLLEPARLAESREGAPTVDGLQEGFGRLAAGSTTTVQVTGRGGVPDDISAAIVNVAAVDPEDDSFLTVFPCLDPMPVASSLNYTPGVNRANELIADVNDDGELCVYTDASIDLIVDVVGYVEPGSNLRTNGPSRFVDTRDGATTIDGLNEGGGPLAPGSTLTVQIAGRDGVPADAIAVVANVAAVDPGAPGFLTVTGCEAPRPNASSINYYAAINGANELVVGLSAGGEMCVYTSAGTDLIVDVVGYVIPGPLVVI